MYEHTKPCVGMLMAALFIIAKSWTQPRKMSFGRYMDELCCLHTMEYCSVMKRNEQSSHVEMWMNLKCLLLMGKGQLKDYR